MKSLLLLLISISAFAGGELKNSETILKKYVKEVRAEKLGRGTRFSYCPDNTCDLLELNASDQKIAWDAGLIFLFYKSTYTVLDEFKKKVDVLEHTQLLRKK